MLNLISIGEHIAERRKTLKLSQAALSRKAGLSRATLDALENGRAGEAWLFQGSPDCLPPLGWS